MSVKIRFFLLFLLCLSACTMSREAAQIPTVAQLPSLTPVATLTPTATLSPTVTLSPTLTSSPTATWTPNQETLIAAGSATNAVQQATLDALQTQMSASPTFTLTP